MYSGEGGGGGGGEEPEPEPGACDGKVSDPILLKVWWKAGGLEGYPSLWVLSVSHLRVHLFRESSKRLTLSVPLSSLRIPLNVGG